MHERFSMSYVTGTHNFKAGVDLNQFSQGKKSYNDPFLVNQAISYTFRNQLPVSVSIYTGPYGPYQEGTENAVLRAGSVDHAEADAEPGPAVQRV